MFFHLKSTYVSLLSHPGPHAELRGDWNHHQHMTAYVCLPNRVRSYMLMSCEVKGEDMTWVVAIVSIEIATQILLPVLLGWRHVCVCACVFPTVLWLNQSQILSTVLPRTFSCLQNISCLAWGVKGHTVKWGWILALSLVWFIVTWTNQESRHRKQVVHIENTQSTYCDYRVGVLQSFMLGSVTFILYVSILPNVCSDVGIKLYVNNAVLYNNVKGAWDRIS